MSSRALDFPVPQWIKTWDLEQWCPRQESNLHLGLRRPLFYPLNYEGVYTKAHPYTRTGIDKTTIPLLLRRVNELLYVEVFLLCLVIYCSGSG
jgi:hypothetical protein